MALLFMTMTPPFGKVPLFSRLLVATIRPKFRTKVGVTGLVLQVRIILQLVQLCRTLLVESLALNMYPMLILVR